MRNDGTQANPTHARTEKETVHEANDVRYYIITGALSLWGVYQGVWNTSLYVHPLQPSSLATFVTTLPCTCTPCSHTFVAEQVWLGYRRVCPWLPPCLPLVTAVSALPRKTRYSIVRGGKSGIENQKY